ncbi:MAG: alpha/beta hydrolase [Caulobacter sp.]|nr:alpha/beta hydrolase [Caulobacter sp.]
MPSFTAADGVSIAYDDTGPAGAAPLLLVHGFSSNRQEAWKRTGWYASLAQRGQRLIALDLRGHGESGKPHDPTAYGRDILLADITGLLDSLNVEWANVFGYSMGAHLALSMAIQERERVGYLILGGVGGKLFDPPPPGDPMALAMEAPSPDAITEPMLKSFRQFADEQGEDRLALAAFTRGRGDPVTREDVRTISAPTLVVAGSRDELAGDPHGLADLIPGAKAVALMGCDHFNAIPHGLLKATVFDFLDGYLDERLP